MTPYGRRGRKREKGQVHCSAQGESDSLNLLRNYPSYLIASVRVAKKKVTRERPSGKTRRKKGGIVFGSSRKKRAG